MSSRNTYSRCLYQAVLVPRNEVKGFYIGMSRHFQRCAEKAVERFEGAKVGTVTPDVNYLHVTMLIPPQYVVSEVVSAVKMRIANMIRLSAIENGDLVEGEDFRAWCSGYYVTTSNKRDEPEISRFVAKSLRAEQYNGLGTNQMRQLAKDAVDRMSDQGRAELLEWAKGNAE